MSVERICPVPRHNELCYDKVESSEDAPADNLAAAVDELLRGEDPVARESTRPVTAGLAPPKPTRIIAKPKAKNDAPPKADSSFNPGLFLEGEASAKTAYPDLYVSHNSLPSHPELRRELTVEEYWAEDPKGEGYGYQLRSRANDARIDQPIPRLPSQGK